MAPFVPQSDHTECGLACLAMVAAHHGRHEPLADLRSRFDQGGRGCNLQQLMGVAERLGLSGRPLRLELDECDQLALPCILHWDLDHFVVLTKVHLGWRGLKAVTVLDPAAGPRRVKAAELSRHFTGVALELTPAAAFRPQAPAPRLAWHQLTGQITGLGRSLLLLGLVAFVLQLFALASPLLNQWVVDDAVVSHDRELLLVLVLGFGVLLLVQTALGVARTWLVIQLGQSLSLQWLGNVFGHLVKLPPVYFERRHQGDVVSRFGSVRSIQQTLTVSVVEAVLDGVMAVAALVMMCLYSATLAAVVAVAVLLYAGLRLVTWGPLRHAAAERLTLGAQENSHFLETLRAIQAIKLFGREEDRRARWQNLMVDVQNRDVSTARLGLVFSTGNSLIFGIENLLVLYLGARLVMDSAAAAPPFTVGMLFAFLTYKGQFTGRVSALIDFGAQYRMLGLHADRLADIVLTPTEQQDPVAGHGLPAEPLDHLPATLELRNVSFRHGPGLPWVLRQVSLVVPAGQHLALVGPSGAGKTTLLKLMLGLLSPTEGQVLYGGVPLDQLGLATVRRCVGTVMQDDVLLTGSVSDNVSFFDPQPDLDKVRHCLKVALLLEDIQRLPMGLHTPLGELGHGLSGGQRQRLLLARALYKRPRVLALDEATSHLDLASERVLAEALHSLPVTQLIIAHRLETIARVQRVVGLSQGRLHEVRGAGESPAGQVKVPQQVDLPMANGRS